MKAEQIMLVERFLVGQASEVELRALLALVRRDAAAAGELAESLDGDLLMRLAARDADNWQSVQVRLAAVLAASPESLEDRIREQILQMPLPKRPERFNPWAAIALVAAAAMIAAFVVTRGLSRPENSIDGRVARADSPPSNTIAGSPLERPILMDSGLNMGLVAAVLNATWAGDPPHPVPGMGLSERTYELTTGLAEIRTETSRIVVEGPAKFRLHDAGSMDMQWGRATVTVEEGGFRLATPSVDVVDLSTVFCVDISPGGDTEVHVLAGAVMAMPPGQVKGMALEDGIRIDQGRAGVFREWQTFGLEPLIANEPTRFANALRPCIGVRQLRGSIHVVEDLPSMDRTWIDRDDILICQERISFPLPKAVNVTRRGSGRFAGEVEAKGGIGRGAVVNSYLLQLGPGDWITERRAEATLEFDNEIVGVVFHDAGLVTGDALFSDSPLNLRQRGLEAGDVVHVSDDRHSLYVDLRTVGVKQVRVLTAGE